MEQATAAHVWIRVPVAPWGGVRLCYYITLAQMLAHISYFQLLHLLEDVRMQTSKTKSNAWQD